MRPYKRMREVAVSKPHPLAMLAGPLVWSNASGFRLRLIGESFTLAKAHPGPQPPLGFGEERTNRIVQL